MLLIGGGAATLVRFCPCITALVRIVVGLTLIGSDVAASVEVGLPVLVLLVVVGSVEMHSVGHPLCIPYICCTVGSPHYLLHK